MSGRHHRDVRLNDWPTLATLAIGMALIPAAAQAQSFDCAKAASPVEHLICANPELAALDKSLGEAIKGAMAAAPGRRDVLLAEERRWLVERDRQCKIEDGATPSATGSLSCLTALYRSRIGVVQGAGAKPEAGTAI